MSVNLKGADLAGANLEGAIINNTSIITFSLGKHFGFYHEGYVKIACHGMSLAEWLKHYEEIGKNLGTQKKRYCDMV